VRFFIIKKCKEFCCLDVGRTLLSVAFDVEVDVDLDP
jgi:hypothetical protein